MAGLRFGDIDRVAAGEVDAFAQLYERYRDPLTRYCRSIVRDPEDTLDALQATMLAAERNGYLIGTDRAPTPTRAEPTRLRFYRT